MIRTDMSDLNPEHQRRESTGHVRRLSRGTAEAMLSGVVTDSYLAEAEAAAAAVPDCDDSILSGGSNRTGGSKGSSSRGSHRRESAGGGAAGGGGPTSRYDPETMERVEVTSGSLREGGHYSSSSFRYRSKQRGSATMIDVPDLGAPDHGDDLEDEHLQHPASHSPGTPKQSGGERKREIGGKWDDPDDPDDDGDDRVHITVDRPSSSRWDPSPDDGDDGADAWGIDVEEEDYAVPRSGPPPPGDDPPPPPGKGYSGFDPSKKRRLGCRAACVEEGNVDRDITRMKWALVALCFVAAIALAMVDIYDAVEQGEEHLGVGGHHRPGPEQPEDGDDGAGNGEDAAAGNAEAASTAEGESSGGGSTIGGANSSPALEISGGQMPTEPPEPPSDLHFVCSFRSVSLSESSYDECERACLQAECCFLPSDHYLSCNHGTPGAEYCAVYQSNCMVLDKDWTEDGAGGGDGGKEEDEKGGD